MMKISFSKLFLIIALLNAASMQCMNFNWLYNTPTKKALLIGGGIVTLSAGIYFYLKPSVSQEENNENNEENKLKKQLDSILKRESLYDRTRDLILLFNQTSLSGLHFAANKDKQSHIFLLHKIPDIEIKIFWETVNALTEFAQQCEKPKEIQTLLLEIKKTARTSIMNSSCDLQNNTLLHLIFKKYSDEVNEYNSILGELKQENIHENALDVTSTEKAIKEYENLIQLCIQLGGTFAYNNNDTITPYELLKNNAKERIDGLVQSILKNYIFENNTEKLQHLLIDLRCVGQNKNIINRENNILNAITDQTSLSVLFLLIEYGISTAAKNSEDKTIIDYLKQATEEINRGDVTAIFRYAHKFHDITLFAIEKDDQKLFDYIQPYFFCIQSVEQEYILRIALGSNNEYYMQAIANNDRYYDDDQKLRVFSNYLRDTEKVNPVLYITNLSKYGLSCISSDYGINKLLQSCCENVTTDWIIVSYLLHFIEYIAITPDNQQDIINNYYEPYRDELNEHYEKVMKEFDWLLYDSSENLKKLFF